MFGYIKYIPYLCINKQGIRYGKDKTIQGRLLRERVGHLGDCHRSQG